MSIPDEQRQKVYGWLDTPPNQRIPLSKKEFRESMRLSSKVFRVLVEDWRIAKRLAEKELIEGQTAQARKGINDTLAEAEETSELARQIREMDEAVFQAGKINKIAKMAELWYKRRGLLIDKSQQEVTHKIDGRYLAREILRARRELEDSGMAQVPIESPVLRRDLLSSTGQGEETDS